MRIPLSLVASAILLSPTLAAQSQLAPFGTPSDFVPVSSSGGAGGDGGGCGNTDDFEAYTVAFGGAENILSLSLDDLTVTGTGQGPGLVIDGVTYSCVANSLQWNGPGWFGQPSKNFLANSGDGLLTITYDSPQTEVCMDLHAFDGFPDTATMTAYNVAGAAVDTQVISVPSSVAVPYRVAGNDIGSITVQGSYSWSTLIDNHEFCSGPGVFTLSVSSLIAGTTATVNTSNGTAGGSVGVAYSLTGGGPSSASAGPCGTVTVDLSTPVNVLGVFGADAAGNMSTSAPVPAGTTGVAVWIQALDIGSCTLSNGLAEVIG